MILKRIPVAKLTMNFFSTVGRMRCLLRVVNMTDHINITSNQPRQDLISNARVVDMKMLSPTVKGLTLKIQHSEFSFKAGQWVDLFIPDVSQVGGFSIASSPCKLRDEGLIELAVKYAKYPPARWIHSQCEIGKELQVRSGGEFFCELDIFKTTPNLLLIGGGVGINPLASIYRYCADLHRSKQDPPLGKVLLLYSSCNHDELIFRDDFVSVSQEIPSMRCRFFVTRESQQANETVERKRINHQHIETALKQLEVNDTICYICGPTSMLTDIESVLLQLGVLPDRIKYEKWCSHNLGI